MKSTLVIDENNFFVHSHESEDVIIILNLNENSKEYLKLSGFAADVVKYIVSHPKCIPNELEIHLQSIYEFSEDDIKKELQQVIKKLEEQSVLS